MVCGKNRERGHDWENGKCSRCGKVRSGKVVTNIDIIFGEGGVSYRIDTDGELIAEKFTMIAARRELIGCGIRFVFENIWLNKGADYDTTLVAVAGDLSARLSPRFLMISDMNEIAEAQKRDQCTNDAVKKIAAGGFLCVGENPMARSERLKATHL